MLDIKQSDPLQEARRTAELLEALVRETERIGERQADPDLRQALLARLERDPKIRALVGELGDRVAAGKSSPTAAAETVLAELENR